MRSLDDRIKAARPEAPPLPADFSARVMDEIARRGLAPRPAPRARGWWRWLAATLLLAGGVTLANAFAYELRMNGSLELLYFGTRFAGSFLAGLPYDLLAAALALAGLGGWLLRSGRLLRVRAAWVLLVSYLVTGVGGVALAESGLNERLQEQVTAEEADWPLLGYYFRRRAHYTTPDPRFRMGRVLALENGDAVLLTPAGEEIRVTLPPGLRPAVGEHVRLAGRAGGGRFRARMGQRCNPARVSRYFHHQRMMERMREHGPGPMGPGMMRGRGPGAMGPGMGPGMRDMGPGMGPGMRGMGPGMGPGGAAPERAAPMR